MSVDAISFSAHADFPQTSEFLDLLKPPHVVLVHGEAGDPSIFLQGWPAFQAGHCCMAKH